MQEETMEIRLLDIFALLVKKVRQFFIIGMACLIAGAGIKFALLKQTDEVTGRNGFEQFAMELEAYETKKDYYAISKQNMKNNINNEIEFQNQSLFSITHSDSLYMYKRVYTIKDVDITELSGTMGDNVNPMEYAMSNIANQYRIYWSNMDLYEDFELEKIAYYKELHDSTMEKTTNLNNVKRVFSELITLSVDSKGIVTLCTYGETKEMADELFAIVEPIIYKIYEAVIPVSYNHNIAFTTSNDDFVAIEQYKQSRANTVKGLYDSLAKIEKEEKALESPSSPKIQMAKFAIILAFLGCCVGGCIYCILPVLQGILVNGYAIEEDYKIRYFGSVKASKKQCIWEKWYGMMTRNDKDNEYINSEIDIASENNNDVLYTSTCALTEEDIKAVEGMVGKNKHFNVCNDKTSLQALKDCKGFVLVEKQNKSNMKDVRRTLKLGESLGKEAYGYVMI